eukprot:gene32216-39783_t
MFLSLFSSAATACTAGYYALAGSPSCNSCPPGHYCPSTTLGTNYTCANGTYAAGGASFCTTCPAGSHCPSTTQAIVIACPVGKYAVAGQ